MTTEQNPLLAQRIPGETVRLPSQGIFYTNGELTDDTKDGEVHVHPMTTYDELILRNPDKVFSGDGIREVISRCVPQVNDPGKLFAKDVDFLVVCMRKVSYGGTIDVEYTHPCEQSRDGEEYKAHQYVISLDDFISKSKGIDPTSTKNNYSETISSGHKISVEPMRFDDFVSFMQSTSLVDQNDVEALKNVSINSLASVVKSVDDTTNPDHIREWLATISPKMVREIDKLIHKGSDWGADVSTITPCKACGEKIKIEVSLNPLHFFI